MEKINETPIEQTMKDSYLDYAMSVIVGRAIPDIRDGLKPVHRRIIYSMHMSKMYHSKPFKKSARVVGDVLGKYHPHGDTAIYDSFVRMAQTFSLRYPLIDGQGNMGSIDGDPPAAMRYTEVRLAKLSEELLSDIDRDTVDFVPNFDGSLREPTVLPAKIPNLLINGSSGIAVGMATNMPPHNLSEIVNALIYIINEKYLNGNEIEFNRLLGFVSGPDFPTGGIIVGRNGILSAYKTGRGRIKVRGKTHINGNKIIITEIPYQVTKTAIIEYIAEGVKTKRILGVRGIHDHSDRNHGVEVVIETTRDANPEVVLMQIFEHTPLEVTFGIINLVLRDGAPKVLSLYDLLDSFILFRKEVVVRRLNYELTISEARMHILEGILKALKNIDAIVSFLKSVKDVSEARNGLIEKYELSEKQANAILEIKLHRLVSLEQQKINVEYDRLNERIIEIRNILLDVPKIYQIIRDELVVIKKNYGDERKTTLEDSEDDRDFIDLIPNEDVVVVVTRNGYVHRAKLSEFRTQARGGVGVSGIKIREDDQILDIIKSRTHDNLLVFTKFGLVYSLPTYRIPEGSRYAMGKFISNLLEFKKDDKITSIITVKDNEYSGYLFFVTKNGVVKRTLLKLYSKIRRTGIIAMHFREGDELVYVLRTNGSNTVMISTSNGQSVRFNELDARELGRSASGVIGIRFKDFKDGDYVAGATVCDKPTIFTITENGYGKRTDLGEYRIQNRGGTGIINIQTDERNGRIIEVKSISDSDEILVSTNKGHIIRTSAVAIRVIGRNTKGVKIMRMRKGELVSSAVIIPRDVLEEKENNTVAMKEENEKL